MDRAVPAEGPAERLGAGPAWALGKQPGQTGQKERQETAKAEG